MKLFAMIGVAICMTCATWHLFKGNQTDATVWLALGLHFKVDAYNA